MDHPNGEPVPVPDRVLLPAPDGRDSIGTFWLLSSGEIHAGPNQLDLGWGWLPTILDVVERDALAMLAAVRWARGQG